MMSIKQLMKELDKREGNANCWKSEAEKCKKEITVYRMGIIAFENRIDQLVEAGKISNEARELLHELFEKDINIICEKLI